MSTELNPDRIRELYDAFRAQNPWEQWDRAYLERVEHFRGLTDDQLRSPREQENLWRAKAVAGLGPGESVSTRGAYTDAEIVDAFLAIRSRRWPDDPGKRARAVQEAYDHLLELVHPRHSPQRPQAKLQRAFAALLSADTNACFNFQSFKRVTKLLLGSRKVEPVEGAVLVRARLRAVLGPEAAAIEHVQRATFCWWLYEHYDTIVAGENPEGSDGPGPEPPEPPKLVLWPAAKQLKGIPAVSGYVETYRAVVSAAQGGATPEDIVNTMLSDLEGQNPKACRTLYNRVRRLGFLEHRDGLWHPSAEGEEFVVTDPPNILVEKLLVQTFGLPHLLRLLASGPMARKEQYEALRSLYPRWESDFTPSSIAAWASSLGLIEQAPDKRQRLTDYGRDWESRLPVDLPVPEAREIQGIDDDLEPVAPSNDEPWPTLKQVLDAFANDPALGGFVFDEAQIRALHLAWHCHDKKRFVILSGLSGTGKTALLYHYARVYSALLGRPVEDHRAIVAVSPDWRDPSGLLGYLNALHADPTFQAEDALRLVIRASRNPKLPYFLILDEMNLARVERYFAPFLSAMETGEKLVLHANSESVNGVPPTIDWPRNLFIGGTVNMDETTHPFSDKVLDRAFTLEFFDVDLDGFLDRRAKQRGGRRHLGVEAALKQLNGSLRPIRRHFGYRTAGEVLDFVDAAADNGVTEQGAVSALLDQALFSKVLPRLRGEQTPALQKAIDDIVALCDQHQLPRCRTKLLVMDDRLKSTGVTRFWS